MMHGKKKEKKKILELQSAALIKKDIMKPQLTLLPPRQRGKQRQHLLLF
jgi:hypothetical protein